MELDIKARALAKKYKQTEGELLEILIEMRKTKALLELGYTSIFDYCSRALKLSNAQSYYFQSVAEKSQEVPALKEAIQQGTITLSQGRRIVGKLTKENAQEWIQKAATLPQRELERAVSAMNPKEVRESLRPVAPTRTELRVGISVELEKKLRRLQDLLGGSLEDTLEKAIGETLERRDPIAKAERGFLRKKSPAVKNVIHWRDGHCTFPGCKSTRWLDVHHIKHRAHGGSDAPENLRLLCSAHHRALHAEPGQPREGIQRLRGSL